LHSGKRLSTGTGATCAMPSLSLRKLLERTFAAEVEGRLPFQTKSKSIHSLAHKGMVEEMTRTFGQDRFGPITVIGWTLTHRGRIAYCEWAATQDIGEEEGGDNA
jgi:hypothetical protein